MKWILLLSLLIVVLPLMACNNDGGTKPKADTTPPATVTDLQASVATSSTDTLRWTAAGNDGTVGTASTYDIRYATAQIVDSTWAAATKTIGDPVPRSAGTAESFIVTGLLSGTTYYFALKTADAVPNWSELSNSPHATTSGVAPSDSGMVLIHSGAFTMGSPPDESGRYNNETPHQVTLTKAFYMCDHTVTQQEWQSVMEWSPSRFSGATLPVETVTWFDCVIYCNRLSDAYGMTGAYTITKQLYFGNTIVSATVTWNQNANGYRLPTEAEWEYACRAGSTTAFCDGAITDTLCSPVDPNLDKVGWYCGNAGNTTHPVKGRQPNAWGLYDMHGNIPEWCWDRWDGVSDYPSGPATDPVGEPSGSDRVFRGGSWEGSAGGCRSAYRGADAPGGPVYGDVVGFRVSRTAP